MAKYLYRTCPKCKDYLGVVVPESPDQAPELSQLPPVTLHSSQVIFCLNVQSSAKVVHAKLLTAFKNPSSFGISKS